MEGATRELLEAVEPPSSDAQASKRASGRRHAHPHPPVANPAMAGPIAASSHRRSAAAPHRPRPSCLLPAAAAAAIAPDHDKAANRRRAGMTAAFPASPPLALRPSGWPQAIPPTTRPTRGSCAGRTAKKHGTACTQWQNLIQPVLPRRPRIPLPSARNRTPSALRCFFCRPVMISHYDRHTPAAHLAVQIARADSCPCVGGWGRRGTRGISNLLLHFYCQSSIASHRIASHLERARRPAKAHRNPPHDPHVRRFACSGTTLRIVPPSSASLYMAAGERASQAGRGLKLTTLQIASSSIAFWH
jgi:hypothetical protein